MVAFARPTYSRDVHIIAAFLRRSLPHVAKWEREGTLAWVKWFVAHGRAVTLRRGSRIIGVVLVRRVSSQEQANTDYADDGGPIAYIEAAAARDGCLKSLFGWFQTNNADIKTIAWVRSKHANRPFISPISAAERRFSHV